ncbi:hypothetical protein EGW08_008355, partial [Elysia chlorotica]
MAYIGKYFHPSEVAMLVLGYLKERNLYKTFTCFIKESKDLEIYWQHIKSGQNPDLNICGYDLAAMLEEFAALRLARSDEGKPFVPAEKKSNVLSQLEAQRCLDEIEKERLKREQEK